MRDKFIRFMTGRYGLDDFSKFLIWASVIFFVLNIFVGHGIFYLVALALMIYGYYRIFSKDHTKRYTENAKYKYIKEKFTRWFKSQKSIMQQRKTHHIYTCGVCRQKIRIPRGKGKIEVTCPKCGYKFIRRS